MYLNLFAVMIALSVKAVKYLEQRCSYKLDMQKATHTLAFQIFLNQQL